MEAMTDSSTTVIDRDNPLEEAPSILPLVDNAIRFCVGRDLISGTEMMDILLDLRIALVKDGIL